MLLGTVKTKKNIEGDKGNRITKLVKDSALNPRINSYKE